MAPPRTLPSCSPAHNAGVSDSYHSLIFNLLTRTSKHLRIQNPSLWTAELKHRTITRQKRYHIVNTRASRAQIKTIRYLSRVYEAYLSNSPIQYLVLELFQVDGSERWKAHQKTVRHHPHAPPKNTQTSHVTVRQDISAMGKYPERPCSFEVLADNTVSQKSPYRGAYRQPHPHPQHKTRSHFLDLPSQRNSQHRL